MIAELEISGKAKVKQKITTTPTSLTHLHFLPTCLTLNSANGFKMLLNVVAQLVGLTSLTRLDSPYLKLTT